MAGVAIATIISQYISAILVTLNLMRSQGSVHLDLKRLRIRKQMLGGILRVGLPAGLSSALFSISNVLIQSSINSFGANAIAGSTGASQLESFVYVSMNSISQAALSFTGQNIGAQKYERVNKVMRICLLLVVAAGLFFGILVDAVFRAASAPVYQRRPRPDGHCRRGAQWADPHAHHLHHVFLDGAMEVLATHAARHGQFYCADAGDGGGHLRLAHRFGYGRFSPPTIRWTCCICPIPFPGR